MKVYDCIMYFDEDLNLELRLNILDKYVDKFVIVEATTTHSGERKNLNFDIKKFHSFKKKIEYIVVDDIPKKIENYKKNWSPNFYRENFNRNAISRALTECSDDDLIIISDADEIPNLEILQKTKINKYALFSQKSFIYKLNLLSGDNWLGSAICYKRYLKSPQWLRDKRFLRRGFLRRIFFKTQIIENGGWHFSFLKTPENIVHKMRAYAHSEYNHFDDIKEIENNISLNRNFLNPNKSLKKILIDENYPNYIRKNQKKYSDWILR